MLASPPETPPPSYWQAVSRQRHQVDRERQGPEAGEVATVRLRGWDREQLGLTVTKLSLERGLRVVR